MGGGRGPWDDDAFAGNGTYAMVTWRVCATSVFQGVGGGKTRAAEENGTDLWDRTVSITYLESRYVEFKRDKYLRAYLSTNVRCDEKAEILQTRVKFVDVTERVSRQHHKK